MFDGPIVPIAIKIAAPMLIGLLLQFCYMLVDTIFISRIDPKSTAIISGAALMFPLFFLFMAISMSMNVGIGSMVGRFIGENNRDSARHVMPSGLLIGMCIGIPAIIGGYIFSGHFLHLLAGAKLSEEAIGYGQQFLNFLLPGLSIMLLGNVFSGILQGEGHTLTIARAICLSTVPQYRARSGPDIRLQNGRCRRGPGDVDFHFQRLGRHVRLFCARKVVISFFVQYF